MLRAILLLGLMAVFTVIVYGGGPFDWLGRDRFDEVNDQYSSVTKGNCQSKSKAELTMRSDMVGQIPVYNQLLTRVWYKNRTSLIHVHNMALNRAFFFSYILQKMNSSENYFMQPNWMYYYFSTVGDVNGNPNMINGSAVYFDNHCHYPNWYTTVPFNKTLNLFGPRTWRHDNTFNQGNYLREPNRQTAKSVDAGSVRSGNYTHPGHKMNPWYKAWMPDITGDMDSLTKFTYYIGIRMSNVTGQFMTPEYEHFAFFGPSSPGARETDPRALPVQFTPPYFDCGFSNKWVVSAVSPIIDFFPRYSNYTHLRRQRVVGAIVMDTDFREIDLNPCDVGKGNTGPSYLSGIHKCKKTTNCKYYGHNGFVRDNYKCTCKGGNHWPWYYAPPFKGWQIEMATEYEYGKSYSCYPTDYRTALPIIDQTGSDLVVEGGAVPITSAGIKIHDIVRGRRSVRNSSHIPGLHLHKAGLGSHPLLFAPRKKQHHGRSKYNGRLDDVTIEEIRKEAAHISGYKSTDQYTTQEIMELAEKVRLLNDQNIEELRNRSLPQSTIDEMFPDDYGERNSVDVEVELDYRDDLAVHEKFQDDILIEHREKNLTFPVEQLMDKVRSLRDRHIDRFNKNTDVGPKNQETGNKREKRAGSYHGAIFDQGALDRMLKIIRQKESVNSENCHLKSPEELQLPGDVGYGASSQFEPEARTALRLTNFLTIYLQTVMPDDDYGNMRGGGRLHVDQMFGEVIANVMGNFKIYSAGLYFDRYKFENQDGSVRELFGPWAYRKRGSYYALDTAGYKESYLDSDWFKRAKSRFATNLSGIKKMKSRAFHRSNPEGTSSIKHEFFPIVYKAADLNLGFWTRPYFRCDGMVNAWVMMFVAPFIGMDKLRKKLEFKGVATVDVPINLLEINQCPMPFYYANAFKNTARCDYFSTNCAPQAGFPFMRGSYSCKCRLGFEYWHADGKEWFEGSFVELEYEKKRAGLFSRFDHLYCRPASATHIQTSWIQTALFSIATSVLTSAIKLTL